MCNIPRNTSTTDADKKSAIEQEIVNHLKSNSSYSSYRASNCVPLPMAQEIVSDFCRAGYWGKIVYFHDGRAAYQSFWISKSSMETYCTRMVYADVYSPR